MTIETIREAVDRVARKYPVSRVSLFGSRADGRCREDSDVDLIVEFTEDISLLTLCAIRFELEDLLGLPVDVIHGPLTPDDMIVPEKLVDLYAA